MFIRVTQVKVKPGQWTAFLDAFKNQSIPELEAMPGFMRVICSGDESTQAINMITMWMTAEQGGGVGLGGQDAAMDKLQSFFSEPPVSSGFDEILEREF
ncbi:MAG: antibiotic biosynthesis monooxygenase [Rhodobacteraceae bacterium]|nr:antibiotic biosynthesis monooxygenase [Paracoccaceae bacterium]